ncbi:hypothetical protein U9M48_021688 [Paspalum notatum var. saurae]|uniref:Uncharacterized protein n=1 Tax=Paspalum notatum var. saurae TaxID=547442 RepID=A0AAQ3WTV6_PASNO
MAIRSSCHRLPSVAAPSFCARKAALRFSTACTAARSSHDHDHLSSSARPIKTVFEDQVRGVVCYRDDRGEVICEGFDEGPRLGMRMPEKACFPWWPTEIRVTDFIELSMLRVLEDEDALN